MTAILNHQLVDPRYVRIKRKQAAEILGISPADFDRRRKEDPRCPKGYKAAGIHQGIQAFRC